MIANLTPQEIRDRAQHFDPGHVNPYPQKPNDGRLSPYGIRSRSGKHYGHRYRAFAWWNNQRYYGGSFATPQEARKAKAKLLAYLMAHIPRRRRTATTLPD